MAKPKNVLWFEELRNKDVEKVGGKNASLGEMYQMLRSKGVAIPNGFAVTADAYFAFLKEGRLDQKLKKLTTGFDVHNAKELKRRGAEARALLLNTPMPGHIEDDIRSAYRKLESQRYERVDVAVRSSATAEDLPTASFAGQQETYLNVRGADAVIESVRKAFASLFTDRAISYRFDQGFSKMRVGLSVGVQEMVRSDIGVSGVIFTLHTETGFPDVILVTGSYGLGETIVQGAVNPDEWLVHKPTLRLGYSPIIKRSLGSKKNQTVYASAAGGTKLTAVKNRLRNTFCLTNNEVLKLAKAALTIENHYTKLKGHWQPMDIEWAKDGKTGKLYIVQARPETVHSQEKLRSIETFTLKQKGDKLVEGVAVGRKIATGKVRVMSSPSDLGKFRAGEVLVTEITDPDWEPIMKKAAAIVTDKGGRTSHAAIVSRELGVPAVVGTGNATNKLHTGDIVTIDCASGSVGVVWRGKLSFSKSVHHIHKLPKTRTSIMVNIGTPDEAFERAALPAAGVGLAREEFIIASDIQVHPMALLNYAKLDKKTKHQIDTLTRGYSTRKEFYVSRLAEGIAQIAAAFYPKPVIVRFSDFKTNEYAQLIGGLQFEPHEENPMIGWRGASRYYDPKFREAFGLECEAMKRARETFGLTNIVAMVPFCRTVDEGKKVLKTMADFGLRQSKHFKVYVMCEIPANVILAEAFLNLFDGFSIGSNDLTQLTVGIDRDGESVRGIADERNEAVEQLLRQAVLAAKKAKKYSGICGQAPSDYPAIAALLVKTGIHSISLSPDTVIPTILAVAKQEKRR